MNQQFIENNISGLNYIRNGMLYAKMSALLVFAHAFYPFRMFINSAQIRFHIPSIKCQIKNALKYANNPMDISKSTITNVKVLF